MVRWCAVLLLGSTLSAPAAPRLEMLPLAGRVDGLGGGMPLAVAGDVEAGVLATAMGDHGVSLLDRQRRWQASILAAGPVQRVAVSSNLVLAAGKPWGLTLIDARNLARPARWADWRVPTGVDDLIVNDNIVWMAAGDGSLQAVDVREPAHPLPLGRVPSLDTAPGTVRLARSGNLLLAANSRTGLELFDVHDPATPIRRGQLAFPTPAQAVQARARYAYVGLGGGLQVVDVGDPGRPRTVQILDPFQGYGVTALGLSTNHLVGGSGSGQFFMAALQDAPAISTFRPSVSLQTSRWGTTRDATVLGTEFFLTVDNDSTHVIELDPSGVPSGRSSPWTDEATVTDLAVDGDLGVVSFRSGRWLDQRPTSQTRVLDRRDPARPRLAGDLDVRFGGLEMSDGRAYAFLGSPGELQIFQVRGSEAAPQLLGTHPTPAHEGVVLEGRAYVGFGGGLEIVDVQDPARPRRIGIAEAPGNAPRVRVSTNWAYVLSWDGTGAGHLRRFDIADPTRPTFDSEMIYPSDFRIAGFEIDASRVVVLVDQSGQASVDLADAGRPLEPIPRLRIPRPYSISSGGLALQHGFVHLVSPSGGYEVLDLRSPLFPRWVRQQPAWRGDLLRLTAGELLMSHGPHGGLSILRGLPGIGSGLLVSDAEPGGATIIEMSERLGAGADWRELGRRTPTGSTFEYVDPSGAWSGATARFYRVRQ